MQNTNYDCIRVASTNFLNVNTTFSSNSEEWTPVAEQTPIAKLYCKIIKKNLKRNEIKKLK